MENSILPALFELTSTLSLSSQDHIKVGILPCPTQHYNASLMSIVPTFLKKELSLENDQIFQSEKDVSKEANTYK